MSDTPDEPNSEAAKKAEDLGRDNGDVKSPDSTAASQKTGKLNKPESPKKSDTPKKSDSSKKPESPVKSETAGKTESAGAAEPSKNSPRSTAEKQAANDKSAAPDNPTGSAGASKSSNDAPEEADRPAEADGPEDSTADESPSSADEAPSSTEATEVIDPTDVPDKPTSEPEETDRWAGRATSTSTDDTAVWTPPNGTPVTTENVNAQRSQEPGSGPYPQQNQYPQPPQYPQAGQYLQAGQHPQSGQYPPTAQHPQSDQHPQSTPGPHQPGAAPEYGSQGSAPGSYPQGSAPGGYPQAGPPGPSPQTGPAPYPAAPGYGPTASATKYLAPLKQAVTWRAALIPPGIALAAGIVVSIILSVMITSMADFSSFTEDTGISTDGVSYALPFILLALSLFGSAVFRFSLQSSGIVDAQGSIVILGAPLLVTVIVVGVLWWLTKRSELKFPAPNRGSTWIRIAISTLAMTLVLFLLQLIFAARFSAFEDEGALSLSLSAITARSFFLPLLVILVTSIAARVAGHFKGTEAVGAPFLRWAIPSLLVTWIHLVVTVALFSIVALFVLPLSLDMPWQTVPLTVINMGLILSSLVHFGGVSASAQGDLGFNSSGFSENLTIFSSDAPGQLWIGLLVVVVSVLIATFVATVTRRPSWTVLEQDKQQWASAWKLPLAFCLVWGLLSMLAIPLRVSMEGSAEAAVLFGGSGAARMGLGPLAWTFLIFAVWGAVIEVLSRTLGPRLVLTFPAIAKFFAGRTVHPHWGQHLGMSEPRFAFIHPDIAAAAAATPTAPPMAPPPGQSPGQPQPGYGQNGHGPAGYEQTGYSQNGQPSSNPQMPVGFDPGPSGTESAPVPGRPDHLPEQPGEPVQAGYRTDSNSFADQPAAGSNGAQPYGSQQYGSQPDGSQQYGPQQFGSQPHNTQPYGAQQYSAHPYGAQQYNGQQAGAPVKPFDKRKATMFAVIGGGAVLALVAALIIVTQVNGRMFGPEAAVEKYFSELSDGDAEGALKIADVDVPSEARTLLTNDILGGAKALPEDVTVQDADVSGDSATVSVTYDLGGSKSTSQVSVHKAGKKALFFDDWKLEAPELFTLAVDTPGLSKVKVNGIDVDTDGSGLILPAFPGLYTIGLAEKSDLISADPVEVRAFLADDTDMEGVEPAYLAAQPSDAFRTEVNNQVKTLIDSCAKKTVAQPDGCPFGSSLADSYEAKGLKWSVTSYPTVSVSSDSTASDPYSDSDSSTGPNGGPAWPISTDTTGEALVTGTYDSFDDDEPFDDDVTFSVSGTAEIVDDKVVITISDDPWDW